MSNLTSGSTAWLTELMVMLLNGKDRPQKRRYLLGKAGERGTMGKIVVTNFYSSLASATLYIINIYDSAFENSVTLDQFFINEISFYIHYCIN